MGEGSGRGGVRGRWQLYGKAGSRRRSGAGEGRKQGPRPGRAGPGRAGSGRGGPGRGPGTRAGRQGGARPARCSGAARPGQRRRFSEEAAAPAGGRGDGGSAEPAGGSGRGRGGPGSGRLGFPEGLAAPQGFVRRPGNTGYASAWPTPFLASINPGGQPPPPAALCWGSLAPFPSCKTGSKLRRSPRAPPVFVTQGGGSGSGLPLPPQVSAPPSPSPPVDVLSCPGAPLQSPLAWCPPNLHRVRLDSRAREPSDALSHSGVTCTAVPPSSAGGSSPDSSASPPG